MISKNLKIIKQKRFNFILIFSVIYFAICYLVVPKIAPLSGRVPVCKNEFIQPASHLTKILNRNYVVPAVNDLLQNTKNQLKSTGIKILYLDANFPFINGFPLWPHLSHNDGKKIDLSFVYENQAGAIINKTKSTTGYGVFEKPKGKSINYNEICKGQGNQFYDFSKYLTLGTKNKQLKFSNKGNRLLLKALLAQPQTNKIFIEPHLKTRLKLKNNKIRFQGCKSVRHDDHIHIQIR